MLFQTLTLENFNSYHDHHTLDLQPIVSVGNSQSRESSRPIILIGGLNGGGKTTLVDAIRLALYGQRAQIDRRQKNQSYSDFLSQCVCRQAAENASATIELSFQHVIRLSNIDKLAEIRVQRTWNRKGKDKLQVFLDGWPDPSLTETWDERVETWLPLGLANLFLFDGEQIKELAEQDTPPASVATAIRTVLGLELPDRLSNHLEILIQQKQRELAKDEDRQVLETIAQRLEQQRADLTAAETQLEDLQEALTAAETDLQTAQIQFEAEGGTLAESAPDLERQRQALQLEIEQNRQNLRHLAADLTPLALIQPLLQAAQQQAQIEQHRQQAQAAHHLLTEHHQRLLNFLPSLKLTRSQTKTLQTFLQTETQTLLATTTLTPWLNLDPETHTHLTHLLHRSTALTASPPTHPTHPLTHLTHLTHTHLLHLTHLTTTLDTLTLKLQSAPSPEDYDRLRSHRDQAQLRHEECQFNVEQLQRRCLTLRRDIETSKADLKRYSDQHISQQDADDFLKAATRAQQTLQAFRTRLTLQKLNDLETTLTHYFRSLLHKASLVHRIMVDQQTFRLSLYDNTGQPIPKHRLSAGEKQLLAIAFLWALASVSHRQLPIVIDTPLSRLDSSHRRNLIDQYFPHASHQMILLSTDTEIGREEVKELRSKGVIAREYLLQHNSTTQQTTVAPHYFK